MTEPTAPSGADAMLDGAEMLLDAAQQAHWRTSPPEQQRAMLEQAVARFRTRQFEMIDCYDHADRYLDDD